MYAPIAPGTVLHNRYRLIGAAGQGKFGQTYLARDLKRSNELCVLKEFVPTATDPAAIEELRQQFQTEAAVLYELQHPQLPRPRVMIAEGQRLYWVREYIEGKSYGVLLDERKAQGQVFLEADALQLLANVLPVLTYLHNRGVVHKNISPNTLILRQQDQLPVLINFGLVRELVARLQLHPVLPQDTLADWGYVPPEQLEANRVYPNSDLFSLAVTTIVLLTGKRPEELYDEKAQVFDWEPWVNITPNFTQILRQMLCPNPQQRFASAAQVWKALEHLMVTPATTVTASAVAETSTLEPTQLQQPEIQNTVPPAATIKKRVNRHQRSASKRVSNSDPRASAALVTGLAILISVVAWKLISTVRNDRAPQSTPPTVAASSAPANSPQPTPTPSPSSSPATAPSPTSQAAQISDDSLRDRRRQLGIDFQFFNGLVDEEFYTKYPQLKDQKLVGKPEEANLKAEWNTIANGLMDKLETLKPETRGKLGTYRRANYDEWLTQLGEPGAQSSTVLDPLADERFYQLLPEQKSKAVNSRTFGQVWYAIAEEQLEAAKAKKATGGDG